MALGLRLEEGGTLGLLSDGEDINGSLCPRLFGDFCYFVGSNGHAALDVFFLG